MFQTKNKVIIICFSVLDISTGGRIILSLMLQKQGVRPWIGFIWLRIGTSGVLLGTW
jgi:hypothetical protein